MFPDTSAIASVEPSRSYAASPRLLRVVQAIVRHPDLDIRLWAAMTILINLDVGDPFTDAEEVAIDVIGPCLTTSEYLDHLEDEFVLTRGDGGEIVDGEFSEVYEDDQRADALLLAMKSPDLEARTSAVITLATVTANGAGDEVDRVAADLLGRFADLTVCPVVQ